METVNNIKHCARCDGNHQVLPLKKFQRPVTDDDGKPIWTHYAICPTTEDPILVA